ncbi:o-acyltransferase like protein [Nephila pilipes]|uniref:O-acyltransferase like protein n=1 Tax=Nephila pilipes TaxID=299642 RepID=A0A8X6UFY6_NEPPI|nr:o-acyltransferase like protein [Nephila pilipes]
MRGIFMDTFGAIKLNRFLLKMEICTFDPCNTVDWQTVPVKTAFFLRHKLEAVENGSLTIEHQLQKPLTKEALYMIYVILTFVGLSVIGTLITLYDYFQNEHKETNCPSDAAYKKQDTANGTNTEYVQKPCATTSDSKSVDHLSFFNEWYGQFVINSHCIITGLFVLGGFLNAYTFFVFYEKTKGNIPYLLFYLNRFRRITPVHLLHLGFFTTLFTYTGSGPLWPRFSTNALCRDTWWRDVLYISNCWSIYEQCIPWTWHIMVDMQLYLISPLFLVPLIKWRKFGYFLTGITICGGSYLSYMLTLKYNLSSGVSRFESAQKEFYIVIKGALQYVDELYTRPYTRISSYLIGFLLALVVYEKRTNKAAKESTVTLFCGWIISIVLMGVFVFALYGRDVSTWDIAVYNGVKELFFSCGFAWMVYVCVTGQADTFTYIYIFIDIPHFFPGVINFSHYNRKIRWYLFKMEMCTFGPCNSIDWQRSPAKSLFFFRNNLIAAENGSLTIEQQLPKPLTNEALYMIKDANAALYINPVVTTPQNKIELHFIFCNCLLWIFIEMKKVKQRFDHLGYLNEWYGQFLVNSHCIITGLFVLGGFLNAYTFFVFYEKTKGNIPYLLFYLNRFRRITPLHMLLLGFYTTLFPYTGSGPLWPRYTTNTLCRDTWWREVLYINNYWSLYEQCIPWAWYILTDMQLYVISPLFLVPLIKWRKLGSFLTGIGICAGSYIAFMLTLKYNLSSGISRLESPQEDFYIVLKGAIDYIDILYRQPYTRISPYLIGFFLAHYVYKRRMNKAGKESTLTLFCGWITSIVLMGVFVFAIYGRDVSQWEIAVYNAVKELFFSCGFAWIVYVCVTGQAGFLTRFFSWKYFVPLSRLCYCVSLVHVTLLYRHNYLAVNLEIPAVMPQIYLIIHIFTISFLISFLVSLIFEIPSSRLFTLYMERAINLKKKDIHRRTFKELFLAEYIVTHLRLRRKIIEQVLIEMDTCGVDPCSLADWQKAPAKAPFFFKNKLEAAENGSLTADHQPKPLTNEALYMIYVILVFVGLSIIGTLITLYDYFCNGCKEKNCTNDSANKKDDIKNSNSTQNGQQYIGTTSDSGWLKASKSFLNCFCIITNGNKLFRIPSNDDPLSCLYGMRLFSTFVVVCIHCIAAYTFASKSMEHLSYFNEWYGQILVNSHSIISGFFVLGGFLNAYSFFVIYEKTNGKIPYFLYYLNRFRRITPLHMLMLGFFTTLYSYTGSGPLWPTFTTNPLCRDTWWSNVLYISNWWSVYEQCLPWTWYIVIDMQLYIISPLFLIPLMKRQKLGYFLVGAAIFGGCLATLLLTLHYNLASGISRMESPTEEIFITLHRFWEYFDLLYAQPYTRISSYLVGSLVAFYVYKRRTNNTGKNSTLTLLFGWIVAIVMMGVCFFALYGGQSSTRQIAVYNAVKEIFFSCGFGWIIYVCVTGQAGFLNTFFSWKYFVPFSRVSYCVNLIHVSLILRHYLTSVKLEEPTVIPKIYLITRISAMSFLISFLMSLIFEFPTSRLFTLYMEKKTKLKKEE